jgi:hypothetical protein
VVATEVGTSTAYSPATGGAGPSHVSLLSLLLRHWRVTLPILLVAAAASLFVQSTMRPTFSAVGTVMVASPGWDPSRVPESIAHLEAAVSEMQQPDAQSFAVGNATVSAGLVERTTLVITASATDASAAERTVSGGVTWLRTELSERQASAGIPDPDQLAGRLLTPTVVARSDRAGGYEAEAVVWIDGLGGAEENPFVASKETARLLVSALSSADGERLIEDRIGDGVSFSLFQDRADELPTIIITTAGDDSHEVVTAFDAITSVLDLELTGRQVQAQVGSAQRIFIDVLARPERPTDLSPTVHPLAILIALTGLAAAGGAGGLTQRRQFARTLRPVGPVSSQGATVC